MTRTESVVFPIFQELKNYTFDEYWRNILDQCASDNFPDGVKFKHNKLYFSLRDESRPKGKDIVIELPRKASDAFLTIIDSFKNKLGLRSESDPDKKQNTETNWKKLKPKHIKDQLLLEYALSLQRKHHLSQKDLKQLYASILLGFQFKKLTTDDIVYKHGKVKKIKGLLFDEKSRRFVINKKSRFSQKSEKMQFPVIYQAFEKFSKEYNARSTAPK